MEQKELFDFGKLIVDFQGIFWSAKTERISETIARGGLAMQMDEESRDSESTVIPP